MKTHISVQGFRFAAVAAFAALGLAALAAAPASAKATGGDVVAQQRSIRVDDLNLQSAEGIRVLYARLTRAAEGVCGTPTTTGSRLPSASWKHCFDSAMDSVVSRMKLPALSEHHQKQRASTVS